MVSALPASAAAMQVVVNGRQAQFDQPPVERAGQVFVPLRGVFEKLGAGVAYQHGFINAEGSGHSVALTIGSHNAVVDGKRTVLDTAPFTIGGRALVPLRFVSAALGASVNYAASTRTVTISNQTGATSQAAAKKSNTNWVWPAAAAAAVIAILASGHHSSGVGLNNVTPSSGSMVRTTRPTISANFSTAVDPNSVAVMLDGNDQSYNSDVSANGFGLTPSYDLGQGNHTVRVTGRSQSGSTFDQSWSFSTRAYGYGPYGPYNPNGPNNPNGYGQNYVSNVSPANGSTVSSWFTVSGMTVPNARVAIAVSRAAGFFQTGWRINNYSTTADGSGRFYQNVRIPNGTGDTRMQITSTTPYNNASTGASLTYHT
jgi:hypothetical protein